jgi:hypothetical protein
MRQGSATGHTSLPMMPRNFPGRSGTPLEPKDAQRVSRFTSRTSPVCQPRFIARRVRAPVLLKLGDNISTDEISRVRGPRPAVSVVHLQAGPVQLHGILALQFIDDTLALTNLHDALGGVNEIVSGATSTVAAADRVLPAGGLIPQLTRKNSSARRHAMVSWPSGRRA